MPEYRAPVEDYRFLLNELLHIEKYSGTLPGYDDVSLVDPILEEAARFCEEALFPLNQSGDQQGLTFDNGKVTLPDGFVDAYKMYVESGWGSFTCDPEYGGQGLPQALNLPIVEMICSANLSFGLLPGLTHGAYNAIHTHASEDLKQKFLPKMVTGQWSGVMCLTEPQAGTDLGLISTKAEPNGDGSYAITGSKIFISCGEHDAVENIIHLVLARLPDAPKGVKGISLFVLPKHHINEDGSCGDLNGVACGSIEHKMGLHASPTCVMNYDKAQAWLVGEPHKGLRAMFTMMNEARLLVGTQGLGIAEIAQQNALAYAKERLQGRALKGATLPEKPADPITVHPDVRRMLLTMQSFTEGARALSVWTALQLDIAEHHPDEDRRKEADDVVQLLTPVIKAYLTDGGHETAHTAMQVLGGYGYIGEYGLEQYARDVRITQIYEGTNGVQALDLVGRKLPMHTGRLLRRFFHPLQHFIEQHKSSEQMAEFTKPLYQSMKSLQQASMWIGQKGLANPEEAAGASVEYLRLFALVAMGYVWAEMAERSFKALEEKRGDAAFYERKIRLARFFLYKILPQHYGLLATLTAGVKYMEMKD